MSAGAAPQRKWTRAEYLAMERRSAEKHELHDGEIFAMAGAGRRHNQIAANLITALSGALRDRPCEVYPSDMKVRIPGQDRYKYPDVSVACGGPLFEDDADDVLLNPLVLCEVLSGSTESYDRGLKFRDYRTIPSLQHYVLASQDLQLVEWYTRQPDGTWSLREALPGASLRLEAIGCEVPVDEIYRKVGPAE